MCDQKDRRLIECPTPALLMPLFSEKEHAQVVSAAMAGSGSGGVRVQLSSASGCGGKYRLHVSRLRGAVLFQASYRSRRDHALYGWQILPAQSRIGCYEVIHIRHRWGMRDVFQRLPLTGGFKDTAWEEVSTYSDDWNFAPHPSLLLFRKNTVHLLFGALDLPAGFGLRCAVKQQRVVRLIHDYGDGVYRVKKDEEVVSPRYILMGREFPGDGRRREDEWLLQMISSYVKTIRAAGLIPPLPPKPVAWHRQPHYCTWGDQTYLANCAKRKGDRRRKFITQQARQDFALAQHLFPHQNLDEQLVRNAVAVIKRERLPFRVFIIDDGWQTGLGRWEANRTRFPDLRRLIDWLHGEGFKVALWWAPLHLDNRRWHWPAARFLADNGRTRMTHGIPLIDYSKPCTQAEHLLPLLRRMISSEPACYNADMIKLDFTADKVQRHIPVHDRQWCGEERYFFEMFKLIATTCRALKEDFCFFTYCPHPYLAQWQELLLTSELWSSDYLAHWEKMRLIRALCPGVGINYFSHMCREHLAEFYELAWQEKCSVSQYGVMGHMDLTSGAMTSSDYQLLRNKLARWRKCWKPTKTFGNRIYR